MLPPAQLLPFAATAADLTLFTGAAIVRGWSFCETTGSASASLTVLDGTATGTPEVVRIALATSESTRDSLTGSGILCRTGIFVHRLTGTFEGVIWFNPITNAEDHGWAMGDLGLYRIRE